MRNNSSTIEVQREENPSASEAPDDTVRDAASPSARKRNDPQPLIRYEFVDSRELARRLTVPTSWVRDQARARAQDPLPHVRLGKYVRFLWGSPELEDWIARRIVKGNSRRVERVR